MNMKAIVTHYLPCKDRCTFPIVHGLLYTNTRTIIQYKGPEAKWIKICSTWNLLHYSHHADKPMVLPQTVL